MKIDKDTFKETLEDVFSALIKNAEAERQKSEPYQELFKASEDGLKGFSRKLERQHISTTLNAYQVLEDKGYKTNNEVWEFLTLLPYLAHRLEKEIREKEGTECCVDKVHHLLHGRLLELLGVESNERTD